jgi:hypothetical protein
MIKKIPKNKVKKIVKYDIPKFCEKKENIKNPIINNGETQNTKSLIMSL